ncbi:cobalamin biosynthesis protein [Sulfuracidifex tepidarius]|uniref:Probable cobalamin biosynthesis protein CobD n=1 Tax=Sulfuracidifex tepidarius TaxID=1294262 RepID=A0A510DXL7_9CREN|nr:cobalamin biosynthesis protein [Sulfuracidifex tepidarius]BBG24730.1 Cobalamin biosynthesis protein CbiB [Sulfuracidifex tepidarius]BBG27519.1 Cobalamin biosynthesis protein CbiB [Sulfuracidifex tepidarius]
MFYVAVLALALDLVGEPPYLVHPVVWTGRIAERLTRPFRGRAYGVFLWMVSVVPILLILSILYSLDIPWLMKVVLAVFSLKVSFSITMLYRLVKGSVGEKGKENAQQLVRRNLAEEDEGHVISAAIESLFESTVDGIVSPLFWFLVLGIPGALLQRLSNTMDSMVGYRTPELEREGWFSAKVDTLMNYVPARITAIFMMIAGLLLRMNVYRCMRMVSSSKIESLNARYPIPCAAGLLDVKLEKRGIYSENPAKDLPNPEDLKRALTLFRVTLFLFLIFMLSVDYCLYGLSFLGYPYGVLELI